MGDTYHACCFFNWLCHGTNLDYRNDPEIGKFYASWKEYTQQLVREYLRLMRDPRFEPIYNLRRTRTLGLDFCTDY